MTECWGQGELRAYFDRELTPEQTELLGAHLAECEACAARYAEIAGRAERVSGLLRGLGEAEVIPIPTRQMRRTWLPWATAVAAGLLMAVVWIPKHRTVTVEPLPQPKPAAQMAQASPAVFEAPSVTPVRRAAAKPRRIPARRRAPQSDDFVVLDDAPFETGLLVRMALGPDQVQADVLVSSDGRPRAFRLVNYEK